MIILPAIDIQDGTCVRLVKGDFATSHKVAEDYRKTAAGFVAAGASWIHMVDLDGARAGEPKNAELFLDVAKNTPLKVELGGGIRSLDTVEAYLKGGISRVILGSIALKNPQIVKDAVKEYGERIAVGIDAKNGMVAVEGWLDSSSVDYLSLAKEMAAVGVQYIIYTDISRDGTLSGVNTEQLQRWCAYDCRYSGLQADGLVWNDLRKVPVSGHIAIGRCHCLCWCTGIRKEAVNYAGKENYSLFGCARWKSGKGCQIRGRSRCW